MGQTWDHGRIELGDVERGGLPKEPVSSLNGRVPLSSSRLLIERVLIRNRDHLLIESQKGRTTDSKFPIQDVTERLLRTGLTQGPRTSPLDE